MKAVIKVLKRAFGALVALVVLFEEWGWEPLQRLMARITRLPGLRQLEAMIVRAPPWAALIVLLLPSLLAACIWFWFLANSFCANGELGSIRPSRASWNGLKS